MDIVAGHIRYFRLSIISKIIYMGKEMGMECVYCGYDMMSIIQRPLLAVEKEVPELVSVEKEEMFEAIERDMNILMGGGHDAGVHSDLMLLYSMYLSLESSWCSFETRRIAQYVTEPCSRLVMHEFRKSSKLLYGYAEYCKEEAEYDDFINRKKKIIIDFGTEAD